MEVTQSNFDELLPLVIGAIDSADFISCDGEFTGLSSVEGMSSYADNLQERYYKNAMDVRRLALIQFGISCFKYSEKTKSYKCATFSFYLMKKKLNGLPQLFSSCVNSMRFLASSNFDFNKLFKDGITYANRNEIADLKKEMQTYYEKETNYVIEEKRPLRPENVPVFNQIVDFIKSSREEETTIIRDSLHRPKQFMDLLLHDVNGVVQLNQPPTFLVPHQTIRVFRLESRNDLDLAKQLLMKDYRHVLVSCDVDKIEMSVKVMANAQERDYFVAIDALKKFYQSVGFTRVIHRILEKGKDLVGHNCYLDLFYLTEKFIEPLPRLLEDFKRVFRDNFTNIIDTKLLASSELNLPNTSLFSIFSANKNSCPKIEAMPGCLTYPVDGSSRAHDAGYDSFITGVAYIAMSERINVDKSRLAIHGPRVKKVANMIPLSKLMCKTTINLKDSDNHKVPNYFCVTSKNRLSAVTVSEKLFPNLNHPQIKFDSKKKIFVYPNTLAEFSKMNDMLADAIANAPPHVNITIVEGFDVNIPIGTKKTEPIDIPGALNQSLNDSQLLSTGNSVYYTPNEDSFTTENDVFGSTPIKDLNKLQRFKPPSNIDLRDCSLAETQNRRGAKRKSGNKEYDTSSDTNGPDNLDSEANWNIVNRRRKHNSSGQELGDSSAVTRSKRASSTKSSDEGDQSDSSQITVKRDFKRMKSVGSEALQNLSLESPVETKNHCNFFAVELERSSSQKVTPSSQQFKSSSQQVPPISQQVPPISQQVPPSQQQANPSKPNTRKAGKSSAEANHGNQKRKNKNQGRNRGQSRGRRNNGRPSNVNFFKETPDWA